MNGLPIEIRRQVSPPLLMKPWKGGYFPMVVFTGPFPSLTPQTSCCWRQGLQGNMALQRLHAHVESGSSHDARAFIGPGPAPQKGTSCSF